MTDLIVCSFHTDDEYYRRHGKELEENLAGLGVRYVIEEIAKVEGQDWADLCRQKVPFLQRICEEHPQSKVFWIDVDCRLISLPDFVRESTADITGFQRGFGSPLSMGYHRRGRFWEPCFWGVNTTPQARAMIADAAELESRSELKATDDYFFEEGWRANADDMTFQVIPSTCVVGKGGPLTSRQAFFAFGSSGNVNEFKDKVVQHGKAQSPVHHPFRLNRARIVKLGKSVLTKLPPTAQRRVMAAADRSGVTGFLVPGPDNTRLPSTWLGTPGTPTLKDRKSLGNQALRAGIDGDSAALEAARSALLDRGVLTPPERSMLEAAQSFAHYATRSSDGKPLNLVWWVRPFPGNFGDWLSPFIVGHYTDRSIHFLSPTARRLSAGTHLVGLGSIGRFIKDTSVVVGTGIASDEHDLHPQAHYCSLRGPLSAAHLSTCGGPVVESFGDPGAVLSRILPVSRATTNGRTAFVRHFKHSNLPVTLPEGYDEIPVLMSSPDRIRKLIATLAEYDQVVTSAMHIMIACQSYGIPCALVVFTGYEGSVPGNGMKYTDYALGVGLDAIAPAPVPLDLRSVDLKSLVMDVAISEEKKDEIEDALRRGVAAVSQKP